MPGRGHVPRVPVDAPAGQQRGVVGRDAAVDLPRFGPVVAAAPRPVLHGRRRLPRGLRPLFLSIFPTIFFLSRHLVRVEALGRNSKWFSFFFLLFFDDW